jgi:hypothetical protein
MSAPEGWNEAPPRTGMSTATKVVLIMLALGSVMMLVCCGGMLAIGWFGYRTAQTVARNVQQNVIVGDAARIQEMARTFIEIEVLPGFEPQSAVNLDLFGDGTIPKGQAQSGKVLTWTNGGMEDAALVIELAPLTVAPAAPPSNNDQGASKDAPVEGSPPSANARIYVVLGQPVQFQIVPSGGVGNPAMLTISGSFRMNAGNVTLTLTIPAARFDEQQFAAMVTSIAEPQDAAHPSGPGLFDDD